MRPRQRCRPGRTTRQTWCFPCLTTALNPTGVRQGLPRCLSPTTNQRWAPGRARTHTHTLPCCTHPCPRYDIYCAILSKLSVQDRLHPSPQTVIVFPSELSPGVIAYHSLLLAQSWARVPPKGFTTVEGLCPSRGGGVDSRRRAPSCGEGGMLGGVGTKPSPLGKMSPCGPTRARRRRRRFPRRPCRRRGRQHAWVRVRGEGACGHGWWTPHVDQIPGQSHRRERGRQRAGCGEAGPGVLGRGISVEGRREGEAWGPGRKMGWPLDQGLCRSVEAVATPCQAPV